MFDRRIQTPQIGWVFSLQPSLQNRRSFVFFGENQIWASFVERASHISSGQKFNTGSPWFLNYPKSQKNATYSLVLLSISWCLDPDQIVTLFLDLLHKNYSFCRANNTSSIPHLRKAKSNCCLVAPSLSRQFLSIWNVCSRDLFGYCRSKDLISLSSNPSFFANSFQSLSPILLEIVINISSETGELGLKQT